MTLYRLPKAPFVEGELRMKSWNAMLQPPTGDTDIVWSKRCKDYWELQERLYGIRLSDFTMFTGHVPNERGGHDPVVSTYAVVLEVLPGERTTDYSLVPVEMARARQ